MDTSLSNDGQGNQVDETTLARHLAWSSKQARILTAGGRAEEFYTPERGFPFDETEMPHHHLLRKDTHAAFEQWRRAGNCTTDNDSANYNKAAAVVGVWTRLLFYGGWEHSTNDEERVFNVQTPTLFIDMRIPVTRERVLLLPSSTTCLDDLTNDELRCYARQHIFAGYTRRNYTDNNHTSHQYYPLACTRHHCIDWNFVGPPRTRPNKWWVETQSEGSFSALNTSKHCWKEWAFATDDHGQHYYCELWEALASTGATKKLPMVALRKATPTDRDGILLVMGDHLQYILARPTDNNIHSTYGQKTLASVVDAALDKGDRESALYHLSIQGGHARRSSQQGRWVVDCAIEPWKEGKPLWNIQEDPVLVGNDATTMMAQDSYLLWKGHRWNVFDTNLETASQFRDALSLP